MTEVFVIPLNQIPKKEDFLAHFPNHVNQFGSELHRLHRSVDGKSVLLEVDNFKELPKRLQMFLKKQKKIESKRKLLESDSWNHQKENERNTKALFDRVAPGKRWGIDEIQIEDIDENEVEDFLLERGKSVKEAKKFRKYIEDQKDSKGIPRKPRKGVTNGAKGVDNKKQRNRRN